MGRKIGNVGRKKEKRKEKGMEEKRINENKKRGEMGCSSR